MANYYYNLNVKGQVKDLDDFERNNTLFNEYEFDKYNDDGDLLDSIEDKKLYELPWFDTFKPIDSCDYRPLDVEMETRCYRFALDDYYGDPLPSLKDIFDEFELYSFNIAYCLITQHDPDDEGGYPLFDRETLYQLEPKDEDIDVDEEDPTYKELNTTRYLYKTEIDKGDKHEVTQYILNEAGEEIE